MQLTLVIIAFAALLWFNGAGPVELIKASQSATILAVVAQFPLIWGLGWWAARRILKRLQRDPEAINDVQHDQHRVGMMLHAAALGFFVVHLVIMSWPRVARELVGRVVGAKPGTAIADLYGLDDLFVIAPFIAAIVGVWILLYPIDRAVRQLAVRPRLEGGQAVHPVWNLRQYLTFNARLQLMTVAAPMGLIVIASDTLDRHARVLREATNVWWITDFLLGSAVSVVFLLTPLLMRYIWTTHRLPPGALRERLESIASRMSLRYRDILIWQSRGMMVNAAVMGIIPQVRYVLLSDGLLESMSEKQIEAVFGHEAGHVRFLHIPYFIVFALLTMLIAGGGMLLLQEANLSMQYRQLIVGAVMVVIWGLVFGWLSHQFEYQADIAGARSVSIEGGECQPDCLVHAEGPSSDEALCTVAAEEFAGALRRVADLNGIAPDDRDWRHPSIRKRIHFLRDVSHDPKLQTQFVRRIGRAKLGLVTATSMGLMIALMIYWDKLLSNLPLFG